MFAFPAPAVHAAAEGGGADAGGDDADGGEAQEEEATQVQVDASAWTLLFNEKAKLHVRVNDTWQDRGVGMCSVRQPTGGSGAAKTYIMFTTLVGGCAGVVASLVAVQGCVAGAPCQHGTACAGIRVPPPPSCTATPCTTNHHQNGKQLVAHELKPSAAVLRFDDNKRCCRTSLTTIELKMPPRPAGADASAPAPPPVTEYKVGGALLCLPCQAPAPRPPPPSPHAKSRLCRRAVCAFRLLLCAPHAVRCCRLCSWRCACSSLAGRPAWTGWQHWWRSTSHRPEGRA
jgi:hypothetical protein